MASKEGDEIASQARVWKKWPLSRETKGPLQQESEMASKQGDEMEPPRA